MNEDGDVEVSFTKLRDEKQQLNVRTKEKQEEKHDVGVDVSCKRFWFSGQRTIF